MELCLTEEDVKAYLSIGDVLESVKEALKEYGKGAVDNQIRRRVRLDSVTLNTMSAALPALGVMGTKVYTTGPHGPNAHFLLFDNSGTLLCRMEADELGRLRTAAVSALATRLMAKKESRVMALFGTGFQAESQLLVIAAHQPLRQVRVWSRQWSRAVQFCQRMEPEVEVELIPVPDPREAVEGVDIVTTATSAPTPILYGDWVEEGVHINAIGSNRADEREVDAATIARASRIVVDSKEQAKVESGDLILAEQEGESVWDKVQELSDLLITESAGRGSDREITLFKSNGLALEDVAVAYVVYRKALEDLSSKGRRPVAKYDAR